MLTNEPIPHIEQVRVDGLKPYPKRARKHPTRKLQMLIASVRDVGLLNPIITDGDGTILSGHLRVEAFRTLGLEHIPAVRAAHLTKGQKAAFVLAANRLPETGTWDQSILKLEFELLIDAGGTLDLSTTGFEIGEIDLTIGHDPGEMVEPALPAPPKDPITQLGELWQLGDHRLYCGDGLDPASWELLMQGERAQLCFTDPPYNVPIKGHVTSKDHGDFAMACGDLTPSEFTAFLVDALSQATQASMASALHYVCMDHRHLRELYAAADQVYHDQINLIVWAKTNAGMGSHYRSAHELIGLFKVGSAPHINNVKLGRLGRHRTNVWTYPGANTFRKGRDQDLADHPTVKPVAMVQDALLDSSNPGDIVIDGFGGSGTLILAAERTGRRARVIELSPAYCDVAVRRWEELTGETAHRINPAPTQLLLPAPSEEA